MMENIVIVLSRAARSDNAAKRPCAIFVLFLLRSVCFSAGRTHRHLIKMPL